MIKAKKVFEHVYIYLTGFSTISDGVVATLFMMDGYSEYAFKPVTFKKPATDEELFKQFEKVFENLYLEYQPWKHPKVVTFITNIPELILPELEKMIKPLHKIVFNEEQTKRKMAQLLKEIDGIGTKKTFLN